MDLMVVSCWLTFNEETWDGLCEFWGTNKLCETNMLWLITLDVRYLFDNLMFLWCVMTQSPNFGW